MTTTEIEYGLGPIDSALIDEGDRIRESYDPTKFEELISSFRDHGQLQNIVVTRDNGRYRLVAGGRRLRACRALADRGRTIKGLQPGFILCAERNNLPVHTKLLLEAEENFRREDYTVQEKAKNIRAFHELMVRVSAEKGAVWTQEMTALSMSITPATISLYLSVESMMDKHESVAGAATLTAAVKRVRVIKTHENRIAAAKAAPVEHHDALRRAGEIIRHGDARTLIVDVPDSSCDLVFFDPPWGDNVSRKSAVHHEAFDDSTEYSNELVSALLPQLYRVLKQDRYIIYWYRQWAYEQAKADLFKAGFTMKWSLTPCIWYKPDKVSDANRHPEKVLNDAYETFLIACKGDPVFYEREVNNVFPYNRVLRGGVIHPTEKPIELVDRLVRMCTVPGEVVLDPTAGSAVTLDAAVRASRRAKGFELSEEYYGRGLGRLFEFTKTVELT
jgi:DNA modification methylase